MHATEQTGEGLMMLKTAGRLWIAIAVLGYVLFLGACDENHDIIVNTGQENEPPLVVTQGPEFPLGTIEVTNGAGFGTPIPWVVVGDPNGLDDISAVLFNVESIRIHEAIIRSSTGSGCIAVLYEPDSVIDITSLIPVPVDIPGFTGSMNFDGGGVYSNSTFSFSAPSIAGNFDHFVHNAGGCISGGGRYIQWLLLSPPAVPTVTNVFLTYLDAEFIGISVTVYDKVGASATTTFPNLRVVYVTIMEKTVSP